MSILFLAISILLGWCEYCSFASILVFFWSVVKPPASVQLKFTSDSNSAFSLKVSVWLELGNFGQVITRRGATMYYVHLFTRRAYLCIRCTYVQLCTSCAYLLEGVHLCTRCTYLLGGVQLCNRCTYLRGGMQLEGAQLAPEYCASCFQLLCSAALTKITKKFFWASFSST